MHMHDESMSTTLVAFWTVIMQSRPHDVETASRPTALCLSPKLTSSYVFVLAPSKDLVLSLCPWSYKHLYWWFPSSLRAVLNVVLV